MISDLWGWGYNSVRYLQPRVHRPPVPLRYQLTYPRKGRRGTIIERGGVNLSLTRGKKGGQKEGGTLNPSLGGAIVYREYAWEVYS